MMNGNMLYRYLPTYGGKHSCYANAASLPCAEGARKIQKDEFEKDEVHKDETCFVLMNFVLFKFVLLNFRPFELRPFKHLVRSSL